MPKASATDFGKVQYLVTRYMCVRADLPLEIQEAVLAMTERIESYCEVSSRRPECVHHSRQVPAD